MLIGSRAIAYWNSNFKIRSDSDFYSVTLIRNPDNHDEQYYIKFQGWYTSYAGAEYDNWSFVEPKQKTITVYS